jgi:hypothetical protein
MPCLATIATCRPGPVPAGEPKQLTNMESAGELLASPRVDLLAQRSCGAATNSVKMAALSTTFEPALLKRVKNFSFRSAAPLREEVVRLQRTINEKKRTRSFPLPIYSAPGGLRQAPGRAA